MTTTNALYNQLPLLVMWTRHPQTPYGLETIAPDRFLPALPGCPGRRRLCVCGSILLLIDHHGIASNLQPVTQLPAIRPDKTVRRVPLRNILSLLRRRNSTPATDHRP